MCSLVDYFQFPKVANSPICPPFFLFSPFFPLPPLPSPFLLPCVDGEMGAKHDNLFFHYGNERGAYLLELFGIICFMFFNSIKMLGVGG
jgi:hypothetical protein